MSIRLVVTIHSAPGKGAELLESMSKRCIEVQQQPGCEQFEVFRSGLNPDKFILLEHWASETALHEHWRGNALRPPDPARAALRGEIPMQREDYEYNRVV